MSTDLLQFEEHLEVQTANTRICCLRAGTGSPILLLHGLVGSSENWRDNLQSLASQGTVYALDLPNMGRSDRLSGDHSALPTSAAHILECMDALGLQRADIVAHSHGGAIALTLAALAPDRVRRLVLYAPANPFCDFSVGIRRFYTTWLGRRFAQLVPYLPTALKHVAYRRMYGEPTRARREALAGYVDGLSIHGTIDHILNIISTWDREMAALAARLQHGLRNPTLLIWGDRDRAVGLHSAQRLLQHLHHGQLLTLPGIGHLPYEEAPEFCNHAMAHWLRAGSRSTPAL